ncbi:hypothetical protein, partial [Brunnivagina elsteri]|uniref:hypothetical protein n=1 Tax=Brunnivagina elsteri TaxID=1247191 RepID=UPI001B80D580
SRRVARTEDFTPTQNANLATGIRTVAKFARCPSIAGELNRTSLLIRGLRINFLFIPHSLDISGKDVET